MSLVHTEICINNNGQALRNSTSFNRLCIEKTYLSHKEIHNMYGIIGV